MISCEEAARLISRSCDNRLGFRERVRLRLHLMMCRVCPKFLRQMRLLKTTAGQQAKRYEADESHSLSAEARERIQRKLTKS